MNFNLKNLSKEYTFWVFITWCLWRVVSLVLDQTITSYYESFLNYGIAWYVEFGVGLLFIFFMLKPFLDIRKFRKNEKKENIVIAEKMINPNKLYKYSRDELAEVRQRLRVYFSRSIRKIGNKFIFLVTIVLAIQIFILNIEQIEKNENILHIENVSETMIYIIPAHMIIWFVINVQGMSEWERHDWIVSLFLNLVSIEFYRVMDLAALLGNIKYLNAIIPVVLSCINIVNIYYDPVRDKGYRVRWLGIQLEWETTFLKEQIKENKIPK